MVLAKTNKYGNVYPQWNLYLVTGIDILEKSHLKPHVVAVRKQYLYSIIDKCTERKNDAVTLPTHTCLTAHYLLWFAFDRFKPTLMPPIRQTVFQREQSEAERDQSSYSVRGRDGERVNKGGDRQSCLSFLRWNRLSPLSSPLLTWPQFLKKKRRASGENGGERETCFLLTFPHITLVDHKHKFRNLEKKTSILYQENVTVWPCLCCLTV